MPVGKYLSIPVVLSFRWEISLQSPWAHIQRTADEITIKFFETRWQKKKKKKQIIGRNVFFFSLSPWAPRLSLFLPKPCRYSSIIIKSRLSVRSAGRVNCWWPVLDFCGFFGQCFVVHCTSNDHLFGFIAARNLNAACAKWRHTGAHQLHCQFIGLSNALIMH